MTDNGSILKEIKKVLGIDEDYKVYDTDVIMFANMAFDTLHQLGVGGPTKFVLIDETQKWSDYIKIEDVASVKSYVWIEVRLAFDPPGNSFGITALQDLRKELQHRINMSVDRGIL